MLYNIYIYCTMYILIHIYTYIAYIFICIKYERFFMFWYRVYTFWLFEIFFKLWYNSSSSLIVDMFRPSGTPQYNPKFPKNNYASRVLNQNNIIYIYARDSISCLHSKKQTCFQWVLGQVHRPRTVPKQTKKYLGETNTYSSRHICGHWKRSVYCYKKYISTIITNHDTVADDQLESLPTTIN